MLCKRKQLALKITLTEGVISYKLRFPFNEFVNINNPKGNKVLPHEPMQTVAEQGLQANDNENIQMKTHGVDHTMDDGSEVYSVTFKVKEQKTKEKQSLKAVANYKGGKEA